MTGFPCAIQPATAHGYGAHTVTHKYLAGHRQPNPEPGGTQDSSVTEMAILLVYYWYLFPSPGETTASCKGSPQLCACTQVGVGPRRPVLGRLALGGVQDAVAEAVIIAAP